MKPKLFETALTILCCGIVFTTVLPAFTNPSKKTIGVVDTETISTTPFLAFSTVQGSQNRQSVTLTSSRNNTAVVYVLLLPRGSTPPADLNAVKAFGLPITAGSTMVGGISDTSFTTDIWVAADSGSQSVQFAEKSGAAANTYVVNSNTTEVVSNGWGTISSTSATNQLQTVSTTSATLITNGGSALGSSALGVLVFNYGVNDVYIGQIDNYPMLVVYANSSSYIPFKTSKTLKVWTNTGTSAITATEYTR